MATIRSTLGLNDVMTPTLRKINRAMSMVLDTFEAVQEASGQTFSSANIAAARQEIGQANALLDAMEEEYNNINNQQNRLNGSIDRGTSAAGGLFDKIKGAAGAYLGMQSLGELVSLSDDITQTRARLDMMNDGLQTTEQLTNMIFQAAQNSQGSYLDMAASVAKLGNNAGDAFRSTEEIVKFAELVQKQFTIAGASTTEASNAMLQLTQALGSGVLRGDELNSIFEQAPNLIQTVADYMGIGIGQIRTMASEGQITADIVKNAMLSSANEIDEKFNQMPKTWGQIWTSIKNEAISAFNPVLEKINELGNSANVQNTINGLIKAFSAVASVLVRVFNAVCAVYNFVADNWSLISPIIGGIAAAVVAYNAALLAHKAYLAAAAVAQGIKTVAEYRHNQAIVANVAALGSHATAQQIDAAATASAEIAQASFNTTLFACPLTWIIALLIALVVVFVMFTEQVMGAIFWLGALFKNIGLWIANCGIAAWAVIKNVGLWFANLGLAIWQVIKNIGAWFGNLGQAVWAIIQNVGAWFGNLGMGVWNVLKAVASNIATAFNNGWIDIQIGFWSMVNVIMQGVKKVAEFANTCLGWMGVNIDTSGLDFAANKIDELNSKKDEYKDISEAWEEGQKTFAYQDVGAAMNTYDYGDVGEAFNTNQLDWGSVGEGFNTFDTFQDGWGSEAYNAGAQVGAGIHDWIDSTVGGLFGGETGNAFDDALGYGATLEDIEGDTSDIADCGNKTSEELAYLRDIAEQEAINRFTTAEIKVDFTSTNTISSDMDIDGVFEQFEREISEALVTAAEGDY